MRSIRIIWIAIFIIASQCTAALALERGTKTEARALAERAAAHFLEAGRDRAFGDFNTPHGSYAHKDLYVFAIDLEGTILAQGSNPAYVGKNLLGVKDASGRAIADEAIAMAQENSAGWTEKYQFPDPSTGRLGIKQSYVILLDDIVLGVGVYKH